MLLTIEKIIFLKTVPLFSATSEETLYELAAVLEEEFIPAGTMIIQKGDEGRTMYIILEGRACVHDGNKTIAEVGDGEVIGELSALDPEPRSADVTAITDMRLFSLEHGVLMELMDTQPQVMRGMIQLLCQRVRSSLKTKGIEGQ